MHQVGFRYTKREGDLASEQNGRPANRLSTKKRNTYQLLYTYSIPPDDGLQTCRKHVEVDLRNKPRINSASSWFSLHRSMEMHGQQSIKSPLHCNDQHKCEFHCFPHLWQ